MATYTVIYKAATALQPEQVRAGGAEVWAGEGMLIFGPTSDERGYQRPPALPLRFLSQVIENATGRVVYEDPD